MDIDTLSYIHAQRHSHIKQLFRNEKHIVACLDGITDNFRKCRIKAHSLKQRQANLQAQPHESSKLYEKEIQEQLENIQNRFRDMYDKQVKFKYKKTSLEHSLRKAAKKYHQITCCLVRTLMAKMLPIELRQQIYSHVLETEMMLFADHAWGFEHSGAWVGFPKKDIFYYRVLINHMGKDLGEELAAFFYENVQFNFGIGHSVIKRFQGTNDFGFDTPAGKYITKITFGFACIELYNTYFEPGGNSIAYEYNGRISIHDFTPPRYDYAKRMQPLLDLACGTVITVHIFYVGGRYTDFRSQTMIVETVMPTMLPIVQVLQAHGFRVSVVLGKGTGITRVGDFTINGHIPSMDSVYQELSRVDNTHCEPCIAEADSLLVQMSSQRSHGAGGAGGHHGQLVQGDGRHHA